VIRPSPDGPVTIEALVVDRYLDGLLARRPAAIDDVPNDLVAAAGRLVDELPRHHPSFTFEERLATRLAAAAARIDRADAAVDGDAVPGAADAGTEAAILIFPARAADPGRPTASLDVAGAHRPARALGAARVPGAAHALRPIVIGGMVTSAALSLAGAVFVAWRRSHLPVDPMVRAVRAVAKARVA
jgi:hypothetical protein